MRFFHLSHNDLDGYGCQYIAKKVFKDGFYYNANYGEVLVKIKDILQTIEQSKEETFFLISDLNLNKDDARYLNKEINRLKEQNFDITLQLLDHHISGEECANKYEWYYLDNKRCATKIVYDYFKTNFDFPDTKDIELLVEAINDVDIWEEEDEFFEFGKVLTRLINDTEEISPLMFPNENREYRLTLLDEASRFIHITNGHILLDEDLYKMKKSYLSIDGLNDTIDNLSSKKLVDLLSSKKEELTIVYKNHKGLLSFGLHSISIPANLFLKQNEEFDFFMNIGKKGTLGLRANGKIDVSKLANSLCGGGGHKNASGGYFDDFGEKFLYKDAKNFILDKINQIS